MKPIPLENYPDKHVSHAYKSFLKKVCVLVTICLIFQSLVLTKLAHSDELRDTLSVSLKNNTLLEVFEIISEKTGYSFAYNKSIIPNNIRITKDFKSINIKDVLFFIFKDTEVSFKIVDEQIVLKQKHRLQKRFTISGFINDSETGEALQQVNVFEQNTLQGTASNQHGYYSLSLPKGEYCLIFSYVGSNSEERRIQLDRNMELSVLLEPNSKLEAVVIVGNESKEIIDKTSPLGEMTIPSRTIASLPIIMSEPDIIKSVQLMPGIQGGSEANGEIYVRGGEPLQNLYLLDNVPIYNCFHLLGLFSVFNSDIIGNSKVIKGGFPAQYGGRLSSVVDIKTKEGNMKELTGKVSLGLISSKLFIEGPIIKDRTSFLLSGRLGYYYVYGELLPKEIGKTNNINNYNFKDFNLNVTHRLSDNHRVFLTLYSGNDKGEEITSQNRAYNNSYEFSKNVDGQNWNNLLGTIGWAGKISRRVFGTAQIASSSYKYIGYLNDSSYTSNSSDTSFNFTGTELNNRIRNYFALASIQYEVAPWLRINTGYKYALLNMRSENIREVNYEINYPSLTTNKMDTVLANYNYQTLEHNGHIEFEFNFWKRLKITSGLHLSSFINDGYQNLQIQPRIAGSLEIIKDFLIKASYSKMGQHLHMLGATKIKQASDLIVAAGSNAPSEESDQYTGGLTIMRLKNLNIHVDLYYKTFENLINFAPGASYFNNSPNWEDKIVIGSGVARGVELFIEKSYGNITGWLGYTFSNTNRKYPGINSGKSFPYIYDHRHYLTLIGKYQVNKSFDLGFSWIFHTGSAYTFPTAIYYTYLKDLDYRMNPSFGDESIIAYYNKKNSYRLPDYHRLDLSANYQRNNRIGQGKWTFSIFNAYNRKNVFTANYAEKWVQVNSLFQIKKRFIEEKKLFGIIPSISYTLSF